MKKREKMKKKMVAVMMRVFSLPAMITLVSSEWLEFQAKNSILPVISSMITQTSQIVTFSHKLSHFFIGCHIFSQISLYSISSSSK